MSAGCPLECCRWIKAEISGFTTVNTKVDDLLIIEAARVANLGLPHHDPCVHRVKAAVGRGALPSDTTGERPLTEVVVRADPVSVRLAQKLEGVTQPL